MAVLDLPRAELFAVRNDLTENLKLNEPLLGDPLTFRFAQFAWSKDGSFILFSGYPENSPQHEYYRYDVASGDIRQLTDDLDFSPEAGFPTISGPSQPFWMDDTTALVHGIRQGMSGLWTINAETGAPG